VLLETVMAVSGALGRPLPAGRRRHNGNGSPICELVSHEACSVLRQTRTVRRTPRAMQEGESTDYRRTIE
jgi:hypothetical protein